ncbi:hypothetical protein CBOM_07394 [Ceraceosorus bombacis]|uniref:Uncharacterized protein n=1 Tax=Ceraceosorus bombacis TaxID=401625 RepID=A0A0P1BBD7_9BASI|nr:hypothetical protein CBOM_07394 [Ceraceosorus bombacis]
MHDTATLPYRIQKQANNLILATSRFVTLGSFRAARQTLPSACTRAHTFTAHQYLVDPDAKTHATRAGQETAVDDFEQPSSETLLTSTLTGWPGHREPGTTCSTHIV